MLITRSLKDLNQDEEEVVVDYLTSLGIDVDADATPKSMCVELLEKTMAKELGRKVPLTAYANQVREAELEKTKIANLRRKEITRNRVKSELEAKSAILPGCIDAKLKILSSAVIPYELVVDPQLGLETINDSTGENLRQYAAVVAVSESIYGEVFNQLDDPIIEISTFDHRRAYARIATSHPGSSEVVLISPLVASIMGLGDRQRTKAFLKLCNSFPEIDHVEFTYYGTKTELDALLPLMIERLPKIINAYSYLSLGMVFPVNLEGARVRVDGLYDANQRPIFAGIIPFGSNDLPFNIREEI
jgi:hypothetical protein